MVRSQCWYRIDGGTMNIEQLAEILDGNEASVCAVDGELLLFVQFGESLTQEDLRGVHEDVLDRARLRSVLLTHLDGKPKGSTFPN